MKNISLPLKLITTLSLVFLLIAFVTCNKGQTESQLLKAQCEYSSVSVIDGTYKIDSNIATANGTKEKLLAKLETEKLIDIKTVDEIPGFLIAFMASVSANNIFDIANPGEEWQEGGWINFGNKKVIINATSAVATPFPTKQLIYCGVGKNMALISYYTGGIRMAQHMIIIKFKDKKIVDLWFNNNWNDYNSDFVVTKDGIIKYLKTFRNGNC